MAKIRSGKAAVQYGCLSTYSKVVLLDQIFDILEYDEDGKSGVAWDRDTLQSVGDAFAESGVKFT